MIRRLLTLVVPLVLPALVYLGWLALERRRSEDKARNWNGSWAALPWEWLSVAGVVLAALTLFMTVLLRTAPPIHSVYTPAHVVNGHVVEGSQTSPPVPPPPPSTPPGAP